MAQPRPAGPMIARILAEGVVAAAGVALLILAFHADRAWLDAHILPYFETPRAAQLFRAARARDALALAGLGLLLVVRPWVGGRIAAGKGRALAGKLSSSLVAILLALLVSEGLLRILYGGVSAHRGWLEEPRRQADDRLGWVYVPSRVAGNDAGGDRIDYAIGAGGERLAAPNRPLDRRQPTILFAGESIMFGYGLGWQDSVPGRVEAMTGLQAANLAVSGYSTDQAYLRLGGELPRFQRPLAVVMLVSPGLLVRNLDQDRPHLDARLQRQPGAVRWRILRLADAIVPFHDPAAVDAMVARTTAILRATIADAQAHGAAPVILVPVYLPEDAASRRLRRRLLDEAGIPYLAVPLDPRWRQSRNGHPDARADAAMAGAIVADLARRHAAPPPAGHLRFRCCGLASRLHRESGS